MDFIRKVVNSSILCSLAALPCHALSVKAAPPLYVTPSTDLLLTVTHAKHVQEVAYNDYCQAVHRYLPNVAHITHHLEKCTRFATASHPFHIHDLTNINTKDTGISKDQMEQLYKDLHYWQFLLRSIIEVGTESLHRYDCIVEDPTSVDPCRSVVCGSVSGREADQDMYCAMSQTTEGWLNSVINLLGLKLGMSNWVAPHYDQISLTSDMLPVYIRYYTVIAAHYITQELEIAVNTTQKYFL